MEDYIGMLKIFGGNFAPKNYAFCDGRIINIQSNTALFSLLGTTYGGNGSTTFALPDLRATVPIGIGQGPGLSYYSLGEIGGSASVALTVNEMPFHNHSFNVNSTQATVTTPVALSSIAAPNAPAGRSTTPSNGFVASAPNVPFTTPMVTPTGGSQPHNNMAPYMGMNYVICLYGIYPSRN